MKLIFLFAAAFLSLGTPVPTAQAPLAIDDVCRAIGQGNVAEITAVMDAEVELSILDQENLYSRADAAKALTAFFGKHAPQSFGKVHQGASKSADAEYCIGTLATANGPFRVYLYVAKRPTGILLQELRFERE